MTTSPLSDDAKEIARDFAKLRFPANEAVMLDDLQKALRHSRDAARANDRLHGIEVPNEEDEDMIHLGDQVTVHQAAPTPPAVAASWAATLAPWLLGPALAAGAAGGYLLSRGDNTPPPDAPQSQWYQYEVERWTPE